MAKTHLKRKYGISPEQRDEMIKQQDGNCAICEQALGESPHTDHCHETNVVRGILCINCNQGLGKFKDSTDRLNAAISYLAKHKSSKQGEQQ